MDADFQPPPLSLDFAPSLPDGKLILKHSLWWTLVWMHRTSENQMESWKSVTTSTCGWMEGGEESQNCQLQALHLSLHSCIFIGERRCSSSWSKAIFAPPMCSCVNFPALISARIPVFSWLEVVQTCQRAAQIRGISSTCWLESAEKWLKAARAR